MSYGWRDAVSANRSATVIAFVGKMYKHTHLR
jgi:hypothetical protein